MNKHIGKVDPDELIEVMQGLIAMLKEEARFSDVGRRLLHDKRTVIARVILAEATGRKESDSPT